MGNKSHHISLVRQINSLKWEVLTRTRKNNSKLIFRWRMLWLVKQLQNARWMTKMLNKQKINQKGGPFSSRWIRGMPRRSWTRIQRILIKTTKTVLRQIINRILSRSKWCGWAWPQTCVLLTTKALTGVAHSIHFTALSRKKSPNCSPKIATTLALGWRTALSWSNSISETTFTRAITRRPLPWWTTLTIQNRSWKDHTSSQASSIVSFKRCYRKSFLSSSWYWLARCRRRLERNSFKEKACWGWTLGTLISKSQ